MRPILDASQVRAHGRRSARRDAGRRDREDRPRAAARLRFPRVREAVLPVIRNRNATHAVATRATGPPSPPARSWASLGVRQRRERRRKMHSAPRASTTRESDPIADAGPCGMRAPPVASPASRGKCRDAPAKLCGGIGGSSNALALRKTPDEGDAARVALARDPGPKPRSAQTTFAPGTMRCIRRIAPTPPRCGRAPRKAHDGERSHSFS